MKKFVFVSAVAVAAFMFSCKTDASGTETPATTATETVVDPNVVINEPTVGTNVVTELTTMKVDRMEHDFGKIPDTDPVETKFVITNTGDKPLVISNAQGSCGCTVPVFPTEPIAPGASDEIQVSFNPNGKEGAQTKTVTITANTAEATTVINIKSDVQKTAQ